MELLKADVDPLTTRSDGRGKFGLGNFDAARRTLGVGDEDIIIPDNLSDAVFKKGDIYGRDVFGDFDVCPFTKSSEGKMQMVCVESAKKLVVKRCPSK